MAKAKPARIALIAPLALMVLGACTDAYERTLNTWRGAPVEELIGAWGPPHEESRDVDGHTIYQWSYREIGGPADTRASFQYKSSRKRKPPYCLTWITVDDADIIRKWAYRGSECFGDPRTPPPPAKSKS